MTRRCPQAQKKLLGSVPAEGHETLVCNMRGEIKGTNLIQQLLVLWPKFILLGLNTPPRCLLQLVGRDIRAQTAAPPAEGVRCPVASPHLFGQ